MVWPGSAVEADAAQHRLVLLVGGVDVIELHLARDVRHLLRVGFVLRSRHLVQQAEDALGAGDRALQVRPQHRDLLDRLVEALDVCRKVITRPIEIAVPNSVWLRSRRSPPTTVTIAIAR